MFFFFIRSFSDIADTAITPLFLDYAADAAADFRHFRRLRCLMP